MNDKSSTIKERILLIADNVEDTKQSFFKKIGVTYGNFTGKNKERPINSDAIATILSLYPSVNPEWLIMGIEPTFKTEQKENILVSNGRKTQDAIFETQEVPLYNLEATAGLKELFSNSNPALLLDTIKIPNLPKCDGAITVTGDSMYPLLKSGDIVLYKEVGIDNIFFGEMYLLSVKLDEWEEYITVKYVQKSEVGNDYVKLVSQNSHHQPKDIPTHSISALALIKASIRINTMR